MASFTSLHTLIKSLSASEKRYFKLFSGMHQRRDKQYVKLFDAIEKQQEPDEAKIFRKFENDAMLHNFSMAKKYLFDQIIAALKAYGSYKDYESDLNDRLETYKILRQKGLYPEAAELLQKCKQFAYEKGLYMRLYFIITEEIIVILFSKITASYNPTLALANERKRVLKIIANYSAAGDMLYNQKLYLRNKNYARTPEERSVLTKNISPMLRWKEGDILSRIALGMYNQAMSDYYNALGDHKTAIHYIRKDMVEKLDDHDPRKSEKTFFVEIGHYLQLCLRHKNFTDFEHYLNEYKKLYTSKMSPVELLIYESAIHFELMYYVLTHRSSDAIAFFEQCGKQFKLLSKKVSVKGRINIYYALMLAHYESGEYKKALKYIREIVLLADADVEELVFAKLVSIIIYYENNDYEGLEYAYRSTYRLMLKTNRKFEAEHLIFKFIRRSGKLYSQKEIKAALVQLKTDIGTTYKRFPVEKSIEYYFDVMRWIDKHIA